MYLNNNLIDGPIPGSLGDLSVLSELKLNDNLLVGGVPESLSSLTALGKSLGPYTLSPHRLFVTQFDYKK